ncbi:MAG: aldolase [Proteobacteria bacterium]|nr:aldolase [Pseudomonadota bacterium]
MALVPNHTKEKLQKGELALGCGIRLARTVDIAKIAKVSGFDWLFLDMEHNTMSIDTCVQVGIAALDAGITPIVRVPGHEHYHATRVLDGGALGVVVPHVNTVAEARRVVNNTKYPPVGHRSVAGGQAQMEYAAVPAAEATRLMNDNTLVVVMLESPEAIRNADKIAAVEGVDVLLIGTSDLTAEMGISGQYGHKRVVAAYERVIAACRKHGKFPGMGGVYDPPLMERYIKMGAQFILAGNDLALLMGGMKQRTGLLRGIKR